MIQIIPCRFTVAFEKISGSPVESIASHRDESSAVRVLQCRGVDKYQLVKELLGYTEFTSYGAIIYHRPHTIVTISPYMIAVRADVRGFDKITGYSVDGLNVYETARVTVRYEAVILRDIAHPKALAQYGNVISVTEDIRAASEFLTIPHEGLFWGTGEGKVAIDPLDAPAKVMLMYEWTYNIRNARRVPSEVGVYAGKINSYPVWCTLLQQWFPIHTLLCGNPEVREEITPDGGKTYYITLRFIYKNNGTLAAPKGWNYFPHITGGAFTWENITDGTVAIPFYAAVNLNDILI